MDNFIPRHYQKLESFLKPNKVLVIFGPRQVGKTTLIRKFLETTSFKYRLETGDNLRIAGLFESNDFERIREFASGYELIVIDEAQKIKNIGQGLKILVDYVKGIRVLVTGSSSFELAGQIGEPLTGRKSTLTLFPFSQSELNILYNSYDLKDKLEDFLIYGAYPEVIINGDKNEKIRILYELVDSYLLKDILELDRVKSSKLLLDLLRLLAFQVGNLVSLSELANNLQIDSKTVARYLDLFEKSFVIFSLRGFSKNLRSELTRKNKYYFYDNGIRNSLISNFNALNIRNDQGMLWENFIFMERLKWRTYKNLFANIYFWRTYENKEIDLIEEREGKLSAYEFKWGKKVQKVPASWLSHYPEASYEIINPENYLTFIK
ncbi:MAG: ATP-binding protein [Bacteroidetes bacterium]|nr:ATP-binding protein [Bacteroidota bacterium]